ncbi:alpha/beta hydrolase [Tundrisphaera sp. TA3]|uniref:alpha/beta hydrolase n=1 Tax=Tundrisphaera sp. TA3 TaxID=3435775 RepID=UPI003EB9388D
MLRRYSLLLGLALIAPASAPAAGPQTFPLWPNGAPGAIGTEPGGPESSGDIPTLTVYLPPKEKATGAAFLVCPGGGYGMLAADHEGMEVAEWLNTLGIAGIVLKYRISPRYRHPAPLVDARRAIRTVRSKSAEWGIDPRRVGVIGFSAGGHLASTLATHFRDAEANPADPVDGFTERPDLAILLYPVVSFEAETGHKGSARNLLGPDATPEQMHELSNEAQVTERTPPTFLAHTVADVVVPVENSVDFAMALRKHKVPFELHLFETGQHGLGLGNGSARHKVVPNAAFQAWPGLCASWLKGHGFLDKR